MDTITELEEDLALTNYVASERDKGFSDAEVKEKLLAAGWDKAKIEAILQDLAQKQTKGKAPSTETFIEKSSSVEKFAKYSPYMAENETVSAAYKIGFYHFLLTNEGLILLRTFPKTLIKYHYKDIELIEYYTNIKWGKLVWFISLSVVSFFFFMLEDLVFTKILQTLPFLKPLLGKDLFMSMNIVGVIIFFVLIILTISNGYGFFTSIFGRIRVLPYREAPIDIITKMTRPVQDFIIDIENRKKEAHALETQGSVK
ncbi:hypothetical protein HYY69_03830 [Candidatus Woesearchaeota archaeon]|nr:hypothetical protein [Candidatus Woesearchaeota archaeon]